MKLALHSIMQKNSVFALAIALGASLSSAHGQDDGSLRAFFEKHQMLGTFALDCSMPVDQTNGYFVFHPLDSGEVQHVHMSGPTTQEYSAIFESGGELSGSEIELRGTLEGETIEVVYRIEQNRIRNLEAT